MTIDEAIIQFKEDAEYNRADLDLSWAEENEQVAKWLEELKDYRDKNKMVVKVDVMNIQELKNKILEAYQQGREDMKTDFIGMLEREFAIQNNANSKFVETIVLRRNFVEQLRSRTNDSSV